MDSIRQAILDHYPMSDMFITTIDDEQHRVIGVNRLEVIVPGDRGGHIEKIPFDEIKYATAYEVES